MSETAFDWKKLFAGLLQDIRLASGSHNDSWRQYQDRIEMMVSQYSKLLDSQPPEPAEQVQEKPLRLEAGKYYKNRKGEKIGPMARTTTILSDVHRWAGGRSAVLFIDNGRSSLTQETPDDLISEWTEPAAPEAPAGEVVCVCCKGEYENKQRAYYEGFAAEDVCVHCQEAGTRLSEALAELAQLRQEKAQLEERCKQLKNEEREMFKAGCEGINEADRQIKQLTAERDKLKGERMEAEKNWAAWKYSAEQLTIERDSLRKQLAQLQGGVEGKWESDWSFIPKGKDSVGWVKCDGKVHEATFSPNREYVTITRCGCNRTETTDWLRNNGYQFALTAQQPPSVEAPPAQKPDEWRKADERDIGTKGKDIEVRDFETSEWSSCQDSPDDAIDELIAITRGGKYIICDNEDTVTTWRFARVRVSQGAGKGSES